MLCTPHQVYNYLLVKKYNLKPKQNCAKHSGNFSLKSRVYIYNLSCINCIMNWNQHPRRMSTPKKEEVMGSMRTPGSVNLCDVCGFFSCFALFFWKEQVASSAYIINFQVSNFFTVCYKTVILNFLLFSNYCLYY
jgi:hypothetical protein